ncbi:type VI secretion system tip protein VgrG [Pseudomonas sp. NFX15]|uniref:type VI secretion system Vgr family protein n=1 Tax=Pseudomonas sp. NFX15 TaxID=2816958 RepID=UPI003B8CA74A
MFALANSPRFTLSLEGEPDYDFKVLGFKGQEAISQPYRFELELVSERAGIPLESLLHRQAFLGFDGQGRGIHGQIIRVGQGATTRRLTHYQISLVPRLSYLDRRINQRIFQHKTVPQIIALVLKDHHILEYAHCEFQFGSQYPERDYCVQYAESDLAFIQRLCGETGIHFHFRHSPDGHRLMFGDDQTFFPRLSQSTPFLPGSGMAGETPVINRFDVRLETCTSAITLADYDFHKPGQPLQSSLDNQQRPRLEHYQFPGQFTDLRRADLLAKRTLERYNADFCQAEGSSDDPALVSGHFLRLAEHANQAWNELWLVTRIEHHGRQPQVLEESSSDDADAFQGYRNTFLATPRDVPYRPPLIEKPNVAGYHCAVVTGPKGSEIHCDEYGRVKVQMKWDRHGELNEFSSCWLRVATGWAHDRYGSVLIPRVGMEVLVGFVHGDADKPLVMACAPNASTPLPLDLPADKTRSIFRSQSSPGGGGYNELRIEDRKGAEEIYLRAQRNWNQDVLQDMHVQVGHQRNVVIGSTEGPASSDSLQVHGDLKIRVINQALNASEQAHFSAGQQVVIESGLNISIQSGGHWINVGPAGIFSSVPIQVGGAPMPIMGTSTVQRKLEPLTLAQILSLKSDAPFCEECARCKEGVCAA